MSPHEHDARRIEKRQRAQRDHAPRTAHPRPRARTETSGGGLCDTIARAPCAPDLRAPRSADGGVPTVKLSTHTGLREAAEFGHLFVPSADQLSAMLVSKSMRVHDGAKLCPGCTTDCVRRHHFVTRSAKATATPLIVSSVRWASTVPKSFALRNRGCRKAGSQSTRSMKLR